MHKPKFEISSFTGSKVTGVTKFANPTVVRYNIKTREVLLSNAYEFVYKLK